ncbi:hypothetical protein [Janibacter melonis]|uniref:hypothetical protein n=1 Tax=Janibacter melonis TaxID=262209 RepID=UPI001E401F41|nr:hypothetical protein [Janibacter melonis]MCB5991531.1 hypothetical protein [Janibacter melonis]
MITTSSTRAATALAAVALLAGCGGGDAQDAGSSQSPASSSSSAIPAPGSPTVPLDAPGDDRLDEARSDVTLEGAASSISWRLPADCYEATKPSSARCDDDGTAFQLVVGGKPGMDLVDSELDYRELAEEDSTVQQTTVDVAGRTFTVLVDDGGGAEGDTGIMTFLHQPEGSPDTFAVVLLTEAPVTDLPSTRVDELYQVLGSLELEPA